jgi:hypothetical protein
VIKKFASVKWGFLFGKQTPIDATTNDEIKRLIADFEAARKVE